MLVKSVGLPKNRSRIEIAGAILKVASEGTNVTSILYKVYLSYRQFHEYYLPVLVNNGLLNYDRKTKLYTTTKKGMEFVKHSDALKI
jgi:predicted transcriptional regulator